MSIINFIKDIFNKMFDKNSIEKIVGSSLPISSVMQNSLSRWLDEFSSKTAVTDKMRSPLNMAYFATGYIAKLMNLELDMTLEGGKRAEYIKNIFTHFRNITLNNAAQLALATSHVVIKPYISRGGLSIELIRADRFFPVEYEGDKLTSCLFIDEILKNDKYYRRAEWHRLTEDGYIVQNRAFVSLNKEDIGSEIPLSSVESWGQISPEIKINSVDKMLFGYFKMPFSNNVDMNSPLPISIYANALITLGEIEKQYSNYCHEFASGRRKRYIDKMALERDRNGDYIDPVDDYVMLHVAKNEQQGFFNDYTPTFREVDLRQGLETQLRLLETQLQISQGTFSINPISGAVTATQVISTDKTTYHTIQSLQRCEEQALKDLIYALNVYCTLYSLAPMEKIEPSFKYGDSVFEDTGSVLNQMVTLVSNGALSKAELRAWWTGESVEQATENLPKSEYGEPPDDME